MSAHLLFKLSGAALIISAGAYLSGVLTQRDAEKLRKTDACLELLRFFKMQIDYYCVPVGEVFSRCDAELLASCGCNDKPSSFDEFLSASKSSFDGEVLKVLTSFSRELGTSYREEQLKSCDYHIGLLEKRRAALASDIEKRRKLNRVLCISASAALALLLL